MYDLGQESMLWYEEDGEHKDVHFEWYGDYMVVWSYNNGDGENLVTIKNFPTVSLYHCKWDTRHLFFLCLK
jgi:hypothetical protein